MISLKQRFLDAVGSKAPILDIEDRLAGTDDWIALIGSDCEFCIFCRGKLRCEGGVTPRVLFITPVFEQIYNDPTEFKRT